MSFPRIGAIRFVRASILLAAVVVSGCGLGTLHLTGDDEAIGAAVEIDGKNVAYLNEFVYSGWSSADPVVAERDRALQRRSGLYPGQKFAAAEVKVSNGVHNLKITTKTGKTLATRFEMQGVELHPRSLCGYDDRLNNYSGRAAPELCAYIDSLLRDLSSPTGMLDHPDGFT